MSNSRKVAFVIAALGVSSCGDGGNSSVDNSSSETSGAETQPASESGSGTTSGDDIPGRMLGYFHAESEVVGYVNTPLEAGGDRLYWFSDLGIFADGTLTHDYRLCAEAGDEKRFSWNVAEGGVLSVTPDVVLPDGTFEWGPNFVTSVVIAPGEGCDDVVVTYEHPPADGRPPVSTRFVPGRICAIGEFCEFTFAWCDGAPPACG